MSWSYLLDVIYGIAYFFKVRVMVYKATFNNISVISLPVSVFVEESGENHLPTNFII